MSDAPETEPDTESATDTEAGTGPVAPDPVVEEARRLTRARARDLRELVTTYVRRHLPETAPAESSSPAPPRLVGSHATMLPLLRLVPFTLAITFVASFFWDFDGIVLSMLGRSVSLEGLLLIVSVSGLIGFFTNWLAITMLFNPRNSRPLFGQGLIPAQRERVIYRLSLAVSEELINEQIIKEKIEASGVIPRYRDMALDVARGVVEDSDFRADVKLLATDYVQRVLASDEVRSRIVEFALEKLEKQEGISGLAMKVYRFVNEDDFRKRLDAAIREIPVGLDNLLDEFDHLLDRVPEKMQARSGEIERWATQVVLGFVENLDVYSIVMENMSSYDERRLEELIKRTSNEQLNYIKYLGGVLGTVGGLVIWRPLAALTFLGGLAAVLWTVDETIFRFRKRSSSAAAQPASGPPLTSETPRETAAPPDAP